MRFDGGASAGLCESGLGKTGSVALHYAARGRRKKGPKMTHNTRSVFVSVASIRYQIAPFLSLCEGRVWRLASNRQQLMVEPPAF